MDAIGGTRTEAVGELRRLAGLYSELDAAWVGGPHDGLQRAVQQLRMVASAVEHGELDVRTGYTWIAAAAGILGPLANPGDPDDT